MAKDPYKVLGVETSAGEAEIRTAYRKLVKRYHPDINPEDTAAQARFQEVSAAFDILGDAETRGRYDRGEIDAAGQEIAQQPFRRSRATAGGEEFTEFSDIFSDLFGRRAGGGSQVRARGEDRRYQLAIDFLDAVRGATTRVSLPGGGGLQVTVPAGLRDGATLRLRGKGAPGLGGGPAGDALVEVTVRPHATFSRDGDDIVVELPISLDEAVLGAKIAVPTIGGRVSMQVPKGSDSGDVLRLRGRGVHPAKGRAGDQRVVLKVVMPERIDPELEAFMKRWREQHPQDPRARFARAV